MNKEDTKITLMDDKGKKYVIYNTEKVDLQKEFNEQLTKLMQENKQLKERIDKAIEYIESRARNAGVVLMPREKELIQILKGANND